MTTRNRATRSADHVLGQNFVHEHDGDADHDHDHFEFDADGPLEDNPIWMQDHVTLVSVGIDIGSSGTQVIFSRINLRRYGEDLTSRYYVVSRETLYPVAGGADALSERGAHRRRRARRRSSTRPMRRRACNPDDIDTGAVILTGEALRRENAEAIAALLSEQGGDFVMRHRRPSHGIDAGGLRLGRVAGLARRGQAHPQHRHRRRHHQARRGRKGRRDRDRGAAYRRPAAGGRRHRPHRPARPGRASSMPAQAGFYWRKRRRARRRAQLDKVADSMADALGRGAHAAADAARGRASLPHRSDRRFRPASTA